MTESTSAIPLAAQLAHGVAELGLGLSQGQLNTLMAYLELLSKWNAVYNLTAVRDQREMVTLHLLDSLALVPVVQRLSPRNLLDAGTGGGLPGIPLAIALPDLAVSLVDAVGKKVAFLNQAKGSLGLLRIETIHSRVEALTTANTYDCIVSRAFASLGDFALAVRGAAHAGSHLVAMKANDAESEIAVLPAGVEVVEVVPLSVPGTDAMRCAVVMRLIIPEFK